MKVPAPPKLYIAASRRHRKLSLWRGFTLIETSVAMMIMSIAVVSMCQLLGAGTADVAAGGELTTAVSLADTVHELAVGLPLSGSKQTVIGPYRNIWDLNGHTFSPPIDGGRVPIAGFEGWSQQVVVQTVDNNSIGTAVADDPVAPIARLTVTIYHNGRYIHAGSWLVTDDKPS